MSQTLCIPACIIKEILALSGSSLRAKRVSLTLLAKVYLSNSLKWSCDSALSRLGPPPSWLAGWLAREFHRGGTTGGAVARLDDGQFIRTRLKVEQKLHATSTCIVAAEWTIFQGLLSPGCDWPGKKGEKRKEKKSKNLRRKRERVVKLNRNQGGKNRKQSRCLALRPSRLWQEAASTRSWLSVVRCQLSEWGRWLFFEQGSSDGSLEVLRY